MGSLKWLTVLALQYNRLTDQIPASLGNLGMLRRLDLGFNRLFGPIPPRVANAPQLQVLDVRNNSLSGMVPSGVITATVMLIVGIFDHFLSSPEKTKDWKYIRVFVGRLSIDQAKEFHRGGCSPLVSLEYSNGWDPLGVCRNGIGIFADSLKDFRFNLEEIESATRCFSEVNLLGKSSFFSVYQGILRDGSVVAVRSINITSWARVNVFSSMILLQRETCQYLDIEDGSNRVLDWSTRASIINGIANGIEYLHSSEANKPAIIHRRISVEKVLLDQHFNPMIADSGLPKLLADDIVFSAIKISAAMGYLAPEYEDFIDSNLKGNFSESEAAKLAKIALACTQELPEHRPTMEAVIQELNKSNACS
ncbi:hypothetical protein GH714_009449 [Hevea brasiliensis]|uniref:Protein kinase domain-containing protein n=1 Tax=Hevea brasiliensis TaxID=3981 RepID=A0A6A6MLA4_HEVBR|nr:hypothetical protein GH714_009449 [Hevea brasiliensis]